MKQKTNARQKRETEELRKKQALKLPNKLPEKKGPVTPEPSRPKPKPKILLPEKTPEEETREFLDYLAKETLPVFRDDPLPQKRKKPTAGKAIPRLDLEDGMPLVEEAVSRMNMGLQELRVSQEKLVKLIHGYGSTGTGGKIRTGVRSELAAMKRKKLIKDYIPGEEFGPLDAASRKLAESSTTIPRDPDWGRMNPGITIVVL
jgi:hypothetical protein